jgi:hypothetical protein
MNDPCNYSVPFGAPKLHSTGSVQTANKQEEWNANCGHCHAEPSEVLTTLWHVGHSINRLDFWISAVAVF